MLLLTDKYPLSGEVVVGGSKVFFTHLQPSDEKPVVDYKGHDISPYEWDLAVAAEDVKVAGVVTTNQLHNLIKNLADQYPEVHISHRGPIAQRWRGIFPETYFRLSVLMVNEHEAIDPDLHDIQPLMQDNYDGKQPNAYHSISN